MDKNTMTIVFETGKLHWVDHPTAEGVSIKKIVTQKEFGEESPSILLVKIPAGVEVPEHVHEGSEDILFILDGDGTIWIDSIGEIPLRKGTVVRVPRNTKHKIFNVKADIMVYDMFSPGIM